MDELRESVEEAWKKAEETPDPEATEEEPAPEPETAEVEPEPEDGEQPEGKKQEELPLEPGKKKEPHAPEDKDALEAKPDEDKTRLGKAPAGWTPRAREQWKNIPESARGEILKRESEIAQGLQQSAGARQAVTRLNQVLEPYRGGLMAAGVKDPFQAIDTLFKTESQLRHGNVQEKAWTVANLIQQYGVDIGTLDDVLSGSATSNNNPNAQIEQLIEQRLAPVNQFLQQQQAFAQQSELQQQQEAAKSVEAFGQNAEFLDDVRNDMADLLDMAAARGQTLTLEDAYKKACALHPEVSKIYAQREREKALMGNQQSMEAKRRAAASLTGKRGGEGGNNAPESLRDAISEAWNQQSG